MIIVSFTLASVSIVLYLCALWYIRSSLNYVNETNSALLSGVGDKAVVAKGGELLRMREEEVARIRSQFISSDQVAQFVETLETLGTAEGAKVTLSSLTYEDTQATEHFIPLAVRIEARGSWDSLSRYLSLVESLPYRSEVKDVILGLDGETDTLAFGGTTSGKEWRLSLVLYVMTEKTTQ